MATENKEVHFFSLLGSKPKPSGPKEGFHLFPCVLDLFCALLLPPCLVLMAEAPPSPPLCLMHCRAPGSATAGRGALLWSVLSLWIWIKFPLWLPLMYLCFPVICYSPHTVKCGRKEFRILQWPKRPCAHTSVIPHSPRAQVWTSFQSNFSTSLGTHSPMFVSYTWRVCAISERWRHRMHCSLECNSCTLHNLFLMGSLGACKLSLRRWQHQPNISDTLSFWTWTFLMVVKHVVCFSFLSIFIISQHLFPINYTQSCISNTLAAAATLKSRMPWRTIHLWTHTVFI